MTTKRDSKAKRTPERKSRVPVSGNRDILTISNQEAGYVYRWVNDSPGRIEMFKQGGWELVTHNTEVGDRTADTSRGTDSLVTKAVGNDITAYAMRIKKEWYDEDQAAKQAEVDRSEESMKRKLNSREDAGYGNVTIS